MVTRRRFLTGLGGAMVALPFLESVRFLGKGRAQAEVLDGPPVYSFFMLQRNGCQQSHGSEPERFWPEALGPLSPAILGSGVNAQRALGVLAPFGNDLTVVRGTNHGADYESCAHQSNIVQALTAASVVGQGSEGLAGGESIDWFIAQQINPQGVEPLTLMSGDSSEHSISYSGPQELRGAQTNPFAVYQNLMGISGADPVLLEKLARRRLSVNDLVREEMQDLMREPVLSSTDKMRLQTHFEAIRDFEVGMVCALADGEVSAMESIASSAEDNDNRIVVAKMMIDLMALAFACDANRTGTLQVGGGGTRFEIFGERQNTYHRISHRIDGDGTEGAPIPNADLMHHEIDKIYADIFLHMLTRLDAYPGPRGGSLLDDSVCLWTNELANGDHYTTNIPQILAGKAGGFLKSGHYIDAGGITHNKLLNTIINAVGIRKAGGALYDSFGEAAQQPGVIDAMIA